MLKLKISKKSEKFLKTLPSKHQKQVALKIMELRIKGHGNDSAQLKGYSWYRIDIGEYCIIYDIEGADLLIVILIGKRNDDQVYKILGRL